MIYNAAAAESLQPCPTLCDPIDGSSPGSPVPGILQARTLEWVAISFQRMKVKSESEVAQSCLTLSDPMDCSLPGFSIHGIFQARVLEWGAIAFSTIRDYYQQLYANKMDYLVEMDKLLEKYSFLKLNQEEIENLNRPIITMEAETVIRNLPANKSPGPNGFTAEFFQKFIYLFFLTFSMIYFFNFIFKLYIIVLVLPNIKMNPPQVYMCSPP